MNWEAYLKELIHIQPGVESPAASNSVWIGPWRLDVNRMDLNAAKRFHEEVVERISVVAKKAIGEALHVLPHEDPPVSEEIIQKIKDRHPSRFAATTDDKLALIRYIDWQKARIAHMATDNGYNEGVAAGYKQGYAEGSKDMEDKIRWGA